MPYELQEKLKEAGFHWANEIYPPHLEELIEACGNICLMVGKDKSVVLNTTNPLESDARAEGSTALEAVAKLWLELNKK